METLSTIEAAYKMGMEEGYKMGWKACEESRRIPDIFIQGAVRKIINIVCEHYALEWETISMYNRRRTIVFPRQVCMFFLYKHSPLSLTDIGRLFRGKDHTTVIHSKKVIKDLMETNADIGQEVMELEEMIKKALEGMPSHTVPVKKVSIPLALIGSQSRPAAEYSNNGHLNLVKKYA